MPSTLFSSDVLASDRKQIGIIGERMFDKNRIHFKNACSKETEKPLG